MKFSNMQPATIDVWNAVSASMPAGIKLQELLQALPHLTPAVVKVKLTNLSEMGYLACNRRGRKGNWCTTDKVPVSLRGTPEAKVLQRKAVDATDDTAHLFPKPVAPICPPPGVPNSVFALGAMAAEMQA